jgi:enoyl-[acyl-carrier-protein] reductase (NADH)
MSAKLNHTVVYVRDRNESAGFVSEILGLAAPLSIYGFAVVTTGNEVGAIAAFTRSLSAEVGGDGITVNAIAPVLTITAGIDANNNYSEKMREMVIQTRSIKREEVAEDLVGACAFLVSDAANFMTGQIMVIDGGATFH